MFKGKAKVCTTFALLWQTAAGLSDLESLTHHVEPEFLIDTKCNLSALVP